MKLAFLYVAGGGGGRTKKKRNEEETNIYTHSKSNFTNIALFNMTYNWILS